MEVGGAVVVGVVVGGVVSGETSEGGVGVHFVDVDKSGLSRRV